jgi:phospholipase/carboxylesterase
MALMYPDKIGKIAGLSGFLPANTENEITTEVLMGKKVFVAHGKLDDMVPIDKARRVVQVLQLAGAEVVYCEDDVGHKLSAGCFRGMDAYFE